VALTTFNSFWDFTARRVRKEREKQENLSIPFGILLKAKIFNKCWSKSLSIPFGILRRFLTRLMRRQGSPLSIPFGILRYGARNYYNIRGSLSIPFGILQNLWRYNRHILHANFQFLLGFYEGIVEEAILEVLDFFQFLLGFYAVYRRNTSSRWY